MPDQAQEDPDASVHPQATVSDHIAAIVPAPAMMQYPSQIGVAGWAVFVHIGFWHSINALMNSAATCGTIEFP
jgi:hypothetical protein